LTDTELALNIKVFLVFAWFFIQVCIQRMVWVKIMPENAFKMPLEAKLFCSRLW